MATYDNKIWLLKNIRDAFIATDDTGLCESVMAGEDFSKIFQNKALEDKKRIREGRLCQPGTSKGKEGMGDFSENDYDREIVTQFDPYPALNDSEDDDPIGSYVRQEDYGGYRQRSNTAQWLDKKEQAMKKAAKIKVIKWDDSSPLTSEQSIEIFSKEDIGNPKEQKSLLAEQLKNCPNLPHRQYLEYAKFDGTAQLGLPTKSFKIFMTMLPARHQNYPIVVCVIANAKIKDLIGFTCYKYSIEHPDIGLGSVNEYGLCIAEDDGEVDTGFPCLDCNEPCSKFGFTCLGLVALSSLIPIGTSCPVSEEKFAIFKTEIFSHSQSKGRHYTGESDTSETVAKAVKAHNEDKKTGVTIDLSQMQSHIAASEATQCKAYRVQLMRKVRTNTAVQLVISLDRIEIEPQVPNKHAFWSRTKYFMHAMDSIAWCQLQETRGNRTTFRIVYSPGHNAVYGDRTSAGNSSFFQANTMYKIHDFECENDTAKEIVEKVNTIIDSRNSPCRREYKIAKEKKAQTRRSFNAKHLS